MKGLLFAAIMMVGSGAFACGAVKGEGFQQSELLSLINRVEYTCAGQDDLRVREFAKFRCLNSPTYAVVQNSGGNSVLDVDSIKLNRDGFTVISAEGQMECKFKN
jgi:hypothetical protein